MPTPGLYLVNTTGEMVPVLLEDGSGDQNLLEEYLIEEYLEDSGFRVKRTPKIGGCWICHSGNGETDDDMAFDMEFDTWYHPECLPDGVFSITEYEKYRRKS